MLLKLKGILNMLSLAGIRAIVVASALMGTAMVAYGGYSLYEQVYTQNRAFQSGVEQFDTNAQIREAQSSLTEARKDYRAWIRVSNTHIDYPVMQGRDDLYYANHDIDGKSSLTGAIYMATDNAPDMSDNYIVIFGHHMDNGAMFGDLDHFLDASYFGKHREGLLASPNGSYDLRIFASMKTDAYDEMVYTEGNRNLNSLLAYIREHASVQKVAEAEGAEKIVALSTCSDAATNGRLVVFAVLTPVEEIPEPSPSVTPSVSEKPSPSVTPDVTEKPSPSVTPSVTDIPVPTDISRITDMPKPSDTPTITGGPTPTVIEGVTIIPVPTTEPGVTDRPTPPVTPKVTDTPEPTDIPSVTPEITGVIEPTPEPATPTPAITDKPSDVTPQPTVTEMPEESEKTEKGKKSWLSRFFDRFLPGGSSYGDECWALVNLICLIVTLYIVLPLNRLKKKYGRIKMMSKVNSAKIALYNAVGLTPPQLVEREAIMAIARRERGNRPGEVTAAEFAAAVEKRYYNVGRFARRFTVGIVIEAIIGVASLITFIVTENMNFPMVLIDKWTILMLLFTVLCWVADITLTRYREDSAKKAA